MEISIVGSKLCVLSGKMQYEFCMIAICLSLKRNFYKTTVRLILLYGTEYWINKKTTYTKD